MALMDVIRRIMRLGPARPGPPPDPAKPSAQAAPTGQNHVSTQPPQSPPGAPASAAKSPNAPTEETVLSVRHYTDRLFAFRTTRPASFRFRSGEFVMIGLEVEGKPLVRAYSVVSAIGVMNTVNHVG
jgi:hypothetical protein